ncbi:Protein of unknown function [Kytococcus aerolatus]|uniref:Uncharacterized protein n=1 Tax=Kytococcus aerolatus TaxID=592308 RepID=A0A212U5Y6_9MICO|nr:DUF2516 family protein [Kytococcus aerolatus]SNC73647.1 Protein of unknown function [Kytococcus aerolatus]
MELVRWILVTETWIMLALAVTSLVVEVRALVHALTTRVDAFPAADARTKVFWVVVLALCAAVGAWFVYGYAFAALRGLWAPFVGMTLLGLVAVIVATVYLASTKPRIEGVLANAQSPGRMW